MELNIFKIEENLNKISNILKLDGSKYEFAINSEINRLYEKFKTTRGYSDLIKNESDQYYDNCLKSISFIIKYSMEVFKITEKITPAIINKENSIDLGISIDNTGIQQFDNPIFYIRDLVEYYLNTFREIFILIENNCITGALARMRVLLEIYCIFTYFLKYPNTIRRYLDHFIVKNYNGKIKYSQIITPYEKQNYDRIKEKYKNEFDKFIKNYGWANNLKFPDSFDEIQREASHDNLQRYEFIKSMYSLLSEYSHSSASIVYQHKMINKQNIIAFIVFSGDMCISIVSTYIDWIFQNFEQINSEIKYLVPIMDELRKKILPIHPLI
jgi:hypothetical protein